MADEKQVVQESTVYESCLDFNNDDHIDVSKFIEGGIDDVIVKPEQEDELISRKERWKKYWKGMPEYDQNDNPPYKQIYLNFRSEEDFQEFAKLVEQNLTDKTKSIWYPKLEKDDNSLKRWIVE